MQNEFSDFFDDSIHQGLDFKWQPDASLGVDQFLLDTEQNSFENFFADSAQEKKDVFCTFPQPFPSLPLACELPAPTMIWPSPLTTPTPLTSTQQLSSTSLLSAMEKKLPNESEKTPPTKSFSSEKQYSLPFSFGSSQKPNPLFIPKKAKNASLTLVQPQDLCSRTTNQVAKDVQLIAEEKAQIRQLPQPQMHGVAQVTRSETERRFLAGCDAVSIEKKILSLKDLQTKNSSEKRKTTHLMEREDIPSDPIRKRGRKAKVTSDGKELISFSNLLPGLFAARKNAEQFHKSIPIELSSDIALLEESINEAALKYLADNNVDLVAKVFLDMIPRLQHTLIYQFVMLFFSQHSTVRCSVNTETFSNDVLTLFSTVAGILSKESCVSVLCDGKLTLLDPLAYKQLPPSSRNNVGFEDRLLWTMTILLQKNISLFEPIATLRVLSLARYSLQLFRFAFRSLLVLKEKEFIEYLLILANQDSLNMLVYLAYVCEETKKINVATIAQVLCQHKEQLGAIQRILIDGNVEIHIMRHLLVYFYRKDASAVETIKNVAARDSVLFDVAELLIGEKTSDKHEKFIESLRNSAICNFLTEFLQHHDVVKARDVFLHSLEYQIPDLVSFYGNLMDLNTLNTAPAAVVLNERLYTQTPLPVKINDSCVFFATRLIRVIWKC